MRVGVLALQGAFIEHEHMLESLGAKAVEVRLPEQLETLDALIIPGGESTTIGKLAVTFGLVEPLRKFAQEKPVWGTCAGMIFLAKDIGRDQPILGVMDIQVNRNAFGRQVDSFETDLDIKGIGNEPFHAVFIRAPLVTGANEKAGVEILSRLEDGGIVAVRQDHLLATAFHPELTGDSRMHQLFLDMVHSSDPTK
ncbi:MAG: pyridoxal 5'-phosphate synthase subunit PdxT [Chloroflexota bacterium]|nr:pyridoxal 5'-phosphate synthase glutaminase subunit PdxT [Chloroflexota bacterium]NOG65069.1 pyridoxal 5'-phosphate synthase glutaminase subunit PdxT [Chloroflexota bacterium]GIK65260.1 MAG: pyridoxal 5'-phosphate synthase subunit PdxT [Chloroflexota bacterium]